MSNADTEPKYQVLPEYTDEAILAATEGRDAALRAVAELLPYAWAGAEALEAWEPYGPPFARPPGLDPSEAASAMLARIKAGEFGEVDRGQPGTPRRGRRTPMDPDWPMGDRVSDMSSLAAYLRARLAEEEAAARAAMRPRNGRPLPKAGELWHWVCNECDTPIILDPGSDLPECRRCDGLSISLRSVESYPDEACGPLPNFILGIVEHDSLTTAAATHIAYWDPARVLAEVAAKRAIIDDLLAEPHHVDDEDPYHSCERVWKANPAPGYGSAVCTCGRGQRVERRIRILAQPYAARDDFPPELHAEIADRG